MSLQTSEAISKIAKTLPKFHRIMFDMLVLDGELLKEIVIESSRYGETIEVVIRDAPDNFGGPNEYVPNIAAAFKKARMFVGDMKPIIETCGENSGTIGDAARTAWCETFGIDENSFTSMTPEEKSEFQKSAVRTGLLWLLENGGTAVPVWNSRGLEANFSKIDFTKMNHSGKDFSEIRLESLDLSGSNFDNCQLVQASLGHSVLAKSTFRKSNLTKSNLSRINANRVDFSGACLEGVVCNQGIFKNACFKGANLTNSRFHEGDIRGADFTDSTTTGASFQLTKYDEKTKLPANFPVEDLVWKGTGVAPLLESRLQEALSNGVANYDEFIEQIDQNFDSERIHKALQMLKKERFQLFSQITPDQVIGIVRSQSDQELVYSCLLTEEGTFSCCTQNLKPCGGLKGVLCKHLLVLIIGLTKSEALRANQAATWVLSSKFHQPKIDKKMMSSIFLQYKSALLGQFDWRPTETIPEDYYT